MSNITNSSTINLINYISSEVNAYMTLFIFIFGTIGNSLNTIVLAQAKLRSNPCVLYFLGSSVSSLGIILVGLPTHLIAGWISTDPTNTNSLLCKLRIFLLYGFRTTSVWLIVLATMDRWFVSSVRVKRRFLSCRRIARKSIIVVYVLSFLLWTQSLYCYNTDLLEAPLKCYGMTSTCRIFDDVVYACSTVIIPSILMLIFGFFTIHNISRSLRVVRPYIGMVSNINSMNATKRRKPRHNSSSLTGMLLLQVILLTVFSLPQAIHQLYLTFSISIIKSPLRNAIENLIINFDFSLTYVGNSIPFYIYTLTGALFRQTLIRLFRSIYRQWKFYLLNFVVNFNNFLFPVARSQEISQQ